MTWNILDPQGNESAKIRWEVVKYTIGNGLDIGCGPTKQFPHWIGIDNYRDSQIYNIAIKPDVATNADDLSLFANQSMDFVFSSHLLEHINLEDVPKTLKEWWRVLKTGGYLVLYLPDEDEYPKVGEEGANPDHRWNVNKEEVIKLLKGAGYWDLVDYQKRNETNEYSLYFVFKKNTKGHHYSYLNPKHTTTCGVVRYGAFGDLIQASSVLAGLKKQGYHITLFTSQPGCQVIKHDPNIDELYIQGVNQVPNNMLGEFWAYQKAKFDKWVNLSESMEGSLLAIPNRAIHEWSPVARHNVMNHNYLEMQHLIAGVPHEPIVKFHATSEEMAWARSARAKMGDFVIVWSLAGSSVHKTYGYLDNVIASIMIDFPSAHVVLVGGADGVILEQGWENEKRVHRRCGKWSIRESFAFLSVADMVIGPETGVLNAACMLPIPKVVFLSHSTEENLTRDWVNTHSLISENTVCPGRGNNEAPACHQLHYGWKFCKKTDDGLAQCQVDISLEQSYKVIWHTITRALEKAA